MTENPLIKYQKQISDLAKKHQISYLALFGSYARGDQTSDSDIDLLVQYHQRVGIFDHVASQLAVEKLLQKSVDLVSINSLDPMLRPNIMKDIQVIYDQRSSHIS